MLNQRGQKIAKLPETTAAPKQKDFGGFYRHLLQQSRPRSPVCRAVLLMPLQAGAAAARGVPVAFADVLA